MDIVRIWNNESQLHTLTGLTKHEADTILPDFEAELNQLGRLNSATPGRPAKLDVKGIFIMVMMFYRHYITLDGIAAIFDLDNSNVKRWIDSSEIALKAVLAKKNLSHLIAPEQKMKSLQPLSSTGKYISMVLNNR